MLAIWSLVPLPFPKPAWTSGSSCFMYCWSLAWRILSITLLACEMSAIVQEFEHSLAFPFFGIGMKTDLFQSCGQCWKLCYNMHRHLTQREKKYLDLWKYWHGKFNLQGTSILESSFRRLSWNKLKRTNNSYISLHSRN